MNVKVLYEGKAKKVCHAKNQPGKLILSYKDDVTAFHAEKKENFTGKSRLNNEISSKLFTYLHSQGITTHFIQKLSENEQLVHKTEIIPIKVVVRNYASGSITKRLGIKDKTAFHPPLVELYFKNDDLKDPLINDEQAYYLTELTVEELQEIKTAALQINQHLTSYFSGISLILADLKLEFGRIGNRILLADEISPDTCRLWNEETKEKLGKDVFQPETGNLLDVYEEVLRRMNASDDEGRRPD